MQIRGRRATYCEKDYIICAAVAFFRDASMDGTGLKVLRERKLAGFFREEINRSISRGFKNEENR